jgi:hypothetical protein
VTRGACRHLRPRECGYAVYNLRVGSDVTPLSPLHEQVPALPNAEIPPTRILPIRLSVPVRRSLHDTSPIRLLPCAIRRCQVNPGIGKELSDASARNTLQKKGE